MPSRWSKPRSSPRRCWPRVKAIERDFGRRPGKRWGARVLDLDLVAWSGGRFASRRLVIPHPRLASRDFVLGPLCAIAPGWRLVGALTAAPPRGASWQAAHAIKECAMVGRMGFEPMT